MRRFPIEKEEVKTPFHQLLAGAFKIHEKRVFEQLRNNDISTGQPRILNSLIKEDGRIQKDLSCENNLKPSTVGVTLLGMEKNGFIRRESSEEDRRILRVFITEKGKEAFELAEKSFAEIEKEALRDFTLDEIIQLKNYLKRINRNLSKGDRDSCY